MNKFLKTSILLAAAAVPAAFMVLGAGAATNLLTNPNFDTNVTGWSIKAGWPTGTAVWDAGTLKLTNTMGPTITSSTAAVECIDGISAGQSYTLKADAMVPSGQKRHGGAQTRVFWYSGVGCTGTIISSPAGSTFVTTLDKWITSKDDFVAPATAKSGQVMLMTEMYKADPGEDTSAFFFAKWDNASFTVTPPVVTPTSTPTKTPTSTPTTIPTSTPTAIPTSTVTPPVDPQMPGNTTPGSDTDNPGDQGSNDQDGGDVSTPDQTPGNPGSGEAVNNLGDTEPVAPVIARHSPESPLAPSTGSGQHIQNGGLIDWRIFLLGMLALIAVSGLAVTVGSVLRSGSDPEQY